MRRVVLVLLAFSSLGLTAAVASSFSANTEDVASFTTEVSISVPGDQLPPVLYVRSGGNQLTGTLDLAAPRKNDSVTHQLVRRDTATVEAQADPERYVVWRSPAAPTGGWVLRGTVSLFIEQNGRAEDRLTAGLLSCSAAEPASSTGCTTIAVSAAEITEDKGEGFKERIVRFGVLDTTIPEGHELRLKIVNRAEQPDGTPVSAGDWDLQWGYLPARQSRLEIAP